MGEAPSRGEISDLAFPEKREAPPSSVLNAHTRFVHGVPMSTSPLHPKWQSCNTESFGILGMVRKISSLGVKSGLALGSVKTVLLQPAHYTGLADAQPLGDGVGAGERLA